MSGTLKLNDTTFATENAGSISATVDNLGVGINTTPSVPLHVRNSHTISANTNTLLVENYATGQPVVIGMRAVADNGGAGNTGAIYFDAGADGSAPDNMIAFNADHQTDTNYDVVIKGNGNVGIGTNTPSHQLTINGETKTNGYNIHLGNTTSIIGDTGTSGWANKPGVLMANGGEFRFHGDPGNIDLWVDGFFVLGEGFSASTLTGTYGSAQVGSIAYSSDDGGQLYYKSTRGWESFTAPLGTSSNPATSGLQLYNAGYPSGYYYISVSGYSDYYMYVDNSRNGGGWVMAVRATVADNQAHCNNSAVNFDGTNGPTLGQTSTRKVSDAWMNAYRSQSPYTGSTAYWLETTGGFTSSAGTIRNMFVDSNATVDTVSSASDQNERTRVSTTFEGTISDRAPNTGTRGFGDHHTSGGTYFAYQRHPEQGSNSGFRNDALGGSDGYLWIK